MAVKANSKAFVGKAEREFLPHTFSPLHFVLAGEDRSKRREVIAKVLRQLFHWAEDHTTALQIATPTTLHAVSRCITHARQRVA